MPARFQKEFDIPAKMRLRVNLDSFGKWLLEQFMLNGNTAIDISTLLTTPPPETMSKYEDWKRRSKGNYLIMLEKYLTQLESLGFIEAIDNATWKYIASPDEFTPLLERNIDLANSRAIQRLDFYNQKANPQSFREYLVKHKMVKASDESSYKYADFCAKVRKALKVPDSDYSHTDLHCMLKVPMSMSAARIFFEMQEMGYKVKADYRDVNQGKKSLVYVMTRISPNNDKPAEVLAIPEDKTINIQFPKTGK